MWRLPVLIALALLLSVTAAAQSAEAFFGMHVNRSTAIYPYPTIPYGAYRTLDSSILWSQIETTSGVYNFTAFDSRVASARAAGVDILYAIYSTPPFHSSNPTDSS